MPKTASKAEGVYDDTQTMRRERYQNGQLVSALPCDDAMRNNKHFPWGCFGDVPPDEAADFCAGCGMMGSQCQCWDAVNGVNA